MTKKTILVEMMGSRIKPRGIYCPGGKVVKDWNELFQDNEQAHDVSRVGTEKSEHALSLVIS